MIRQSVNLVLAKLVMHLYLFFQTFNKFCLVIG